VISNRHVTRQLNPSLKNHLLQMANLSIMDCAANVPTVTHVMNGAHFGLEPSDFSTIIVSPKQYNYFVILFKKRNRTLSGCFFYIQNITYWILSCSPGPLHFTDVTILIMEIIKELR